MTRLATLFTCSFRRLKEVRTVTVCAMLGAIAIVLGSLSIDLGPSVRIGFSGIPNELVHYLFGPAAGSLFAGAIVFTDVFSAADTHHDGGSIAPEKPGA